MASTESKDEWPQVNELSLMKLARRLRLGAWSSSSYTRGHSARACFRSFARSLNDHGFKEHVQNVDDKTKTMNTWRGQDSLLPMFIIIILLLFAQVHRRFNELCL